MTISKKGIRLSLEQIIGLIIVSAVILVTINIFVGFYSIFVSDKTDQGTALSFQELTEKVKNLGENEKIIASIFTQRNKAIVGFQADGEGVKHSIGILATEGEGAILGTGKIDRPSTCSADKACLCLCNNEWSQSDACQTAQCVEYDLNAFVVYETGKENKCNWGADWTTDDASDYFIFIQDRITTFKNCKVEPFIFERGKGENIYIAPPSS